MAKKKYRYSELSSKAKKKARLDYLKDWNNANPNDPFSEEEVGEFLLDHNDDDFYTEDGKLLDS